MMHRLAGTLLVIALLATGCSMLPGLGQDVDPACEGRPDAVDCDAALQAAKTGGGLDLQRYSLEVGSISCDAAGCRTWVNAGPPGDECWPLYGFELVRPAGGQWTVESSFHADPACAFEP